MIGKPTMTGDRSLLIILLISRGRTRSLHIAKFHRGVELRGTAMEDPPTTVPAPPWES